MTRGRSRVVQAGVAGLATVVAVTGCGAGSRTGAETATQVACDLGEQPEPVTVDVLAYNSSAIDPFTNTMVTSCSQGDVTLTHEPIDFAGQVQKTTATLAGETGTYDIIETYGFVIPQYASEGNLQPLDAFFDQYSEQYELDQINQDMIQGMSYDGQMYGLPMQAQMFVMAYRQDIFDQVGIEPPTTFEELRQAAQRIQEAGAVEYPLALPWLASSDIITAYDAALGSLGIPMTDPESRTANFDKPEATQAFEALLSLKPFMDPDVTTFDQPAVQQQLYNGSAAIGIMFSGRMADLVQEDNSQYFDDFAFAPPPSVEPGGTLYNALSIDGWSIPSNTEVDPELLFQAMASSVSADASEAALPAAYPAREGIVTGDSSPYAEAASTSIQNAPPAEPYPWTSRISNEITPVVASVIIGDTPVDEGTRQMQDIATQILSDSQ
jgi:sorbitol/mannitol transport system substrate-binding protein